MGKPTLRLMRNGRMLLTNVWQQPSEQLNASKTKYGGYSFPVCGDIIRRLRKQYGEEVQIENDLFEIFQVIAVRQKALFEISEAEDWEGRADLYPHQRVGVAWLALAGRAILADDRGLGKTVQTVAAAAMTGASNVLITCPTAMADTWAEHVRFWAGAEAAIVRGTADQRQAMLDGYDGGWLICNPDVLSIHKTWFLKAGLDLLIVDEAHALRNRKTNYSKDIVRLSGVVKRIYLLTGTPKVNKEADWWPLLRVVDPDRFGSYWSFVYRFCEVDDTGFGLKVGGVRQEEVENLSRILKPYVLRREKSIIAGLPKREFVTVSVDLLGEQGRLYEEMEHEWATKFAEKTVEADVKIAAITRMRQLVLDPGTVFDGYDGPVAKAEALLRFLSDHEGKVVVFSNFAEVVKRFAETLNEKGIKSVWITGETSAEDRDAAVRALQKGDARVFLATMKTGGEGLTLTAANAVVLLDPAWHPAGNDQAMDRVYRIGQKAPVVTTVIIEAPNTVEDFVWDTVRRKGKVSVDDLVDGLKTRKERNA